MVARVEVRNETWQSHDSMMSLLRR